MSMTIPEVIKRFLDEPQPNVSRIENERGLQLELGLMLRQRGFKVGFEVSCSVKSNIQQTKRQKRDVDLLVKAQYDICAIELKVPLSGRVPETIYDFYADIAFMEAIVEAGFADVGLCILLTNDSQFWRGTKISEVYAPLRNQENTLTGLITKPTGGRNTTVFIEGVYHLTWHPLYEADLLPNAQYVVCEIKK